MRPFLGPRTSSGLLSGTSPQPQGPALYAARGAAVHRPTFVAGWCCTASGVQYLSSGYLTLRFSGLNFHAYLADYLVDLVLSVQQRRPRASSRGTDASGEPAPGPAFFSSCG